MIEEIKKNWLYIIAFVLINLVVLNVAMVFGEPFEVGDLVAPMVLIFNIIAGLSSFFAALIVTFAISRKTTDFREGLFVIIFSVIVFSLIGIVMNFFPLLFLNTEAWEQGYLDAVLAMPYEFSMEQFKTMTYFDAIKQVFILLSQNTGAAFFGFIIGRKIIR